MPPARAGRRKSVLRRARERAATSSERCSLDKLSAERCLGGPSRSCHGEGNRQQSGPERLLDLSGVGGGGTFLQKDAEQERPYLAAKPGKDRRIRPDALIRGNPAGSLVTPKEACTIEKRKMTKEDVHLAISVLDFRERMVFLLAVLVGMRPGEIFALRWGRIGSEVLEVMERVYRGLPDDPKTERGRREAAVPPDLAGELDQWREMYEMSLDTRPDALVFRSERGTFLSRDNFLRRNIHAKLEKVGLGWVNF
jgi:integrase